MKNILNLCNNRAPKKSASAFKLSPLVVALFLLLWSCDADTCSSTILVKMEELVEKKYKDNLSNTKYLSKKQVAHKIVEKYCEELVALEKEYPQLKAYYAEHDMHRCDGLMLVKLASIESDFVDTNAQNMHLFHNTWDYVKWQNKKELLKWEANFSWNYALVEKKLRFLWISLEDQFKKLSDQWFEMLCAKMYLCTLQSELKRNHLSADDANLFLTRNIWVPNMRYLSTQKWVDDIDEIIDYFENQLRGHIHNINKRVSSKDIKKLRNHLLWNKQNEKSEKVAEKLKKYLKEYPIYFGRDFKTVSEKWIKKKVKAKKKNMYEAYRHALWSKEFWE